MWFKRLNRFSYYSAVTNSTSQWMILEQLLYTDIKGATVTKSDVASFLRSAEIHPLKGESKLSQKWR